MYAGEQVHAGGRYLCSVWFLYLLAGIEKARMFCGSSRLFSATVWPPPITLSSLLSYIFSPSKVLSQVGLCWWDQTSIRLPFKQQHSVLSLLSPALPLCPPLSSLWLSHLPSPQYSFILTSSLFHVSFLSLSSLNDGVSSDLHCCYHIYCKLSSRSTWRTLMSAALWNNSDLQRVNGMQQFTVWCWWTVKK